MLEALQSSKTATRNMKKLSATLLPTILIICNISGSESGKILMMPDPIDSHMTMFAAVTNELAERGHQIYTLTVDHKYISTSTKSLNKNIVVYKGDSSLDIDNIFEKVVEVSVNDNADTKKMFQEISSDVMKEAHALLMNNEEVMSELQSLRLDLAVVDGFAFSKYKYLVPHRLGIPVVTLSDVIEPWIARAPWVPSFVPVAMLPLTEKMSFMERVQNMMVYIAMHFVSFTPKLTPDILQKYSLYGPLRSADDVAKKSVLWITTTDVTLDYPKPRMPNMVEAGGLTAKPGKPLTAEWQKIFERASHGVILVSFGSTTSAFPTEIAENLLQAFGSLQQTVVWRFKNKQNLFIPNNVYITDWLPQNDMLAHSKVKVFVTHCGSNGQFEAIYHAVPMVGMPLFVDQHYNAKRMVHKGYGVQLDIKTFTPAELMNALHEVLENPMYREKITKASLIFHDRPDTPAERAASSIEHVLTFGGEHLQSYGSDLPLYQFLMLDVMAVLCVVALIVMVFVKWIIKLGYKQCCRTNTYQQKLKSQ